MTYPDEQAVDRWFPMSREYRPRRILSVDRSKDVILGDHVVVEGF